MSLPMDMVRAGRPIREVLPIAASMEAAAFEKHFSEVNDNDLMLLGAWTSRMLNSFGIESTLWLGGVLSMYGAATATESRAELFDRMIDEIGLSRTQAYRNIAVWKRAGKSLFAEPKLASKFVVEALKILSAESCPDSALEQAFKAARQGQKVDIEFATKLKRRLKPSVVDENREESTSSGKPRDTSADKSSSIQDSPVRQDQRVFKGRMVNIVLRPLAQPEYVDLQAAIDDLLLFVGELQRELLGSEAKSQLNGTEVQHV